MRAFRTEAEADAWVAQQMARRQPHRVTIERIPFARLHPDEVARSFESMLQREVEQLAQAELAARRARREAKAAAKKSGLSP